MANTKYTLVYTGEEVDERLGRQDNIQLSTVHAELDGDYQATIPGTLESAIVCDVTNYYLSDARVVAKKDDAFTNSAEQPLLGIKNANNDYLVPYANGNQMVSGGNPLGGILCMASFLKQGITYGNDNSVFDSTGGDHNQLVCSDYVELGLRGISYNNSKASGCGENFESQYKSRTCKNNHSLLAPNEKDALITRELAYVFAANNALYELDYERLSNLNVGDVLFFASSSSAAEVTTNYLNIHHCSMVVDVDYANHYVCVLESGSATETIFWYCYTEDGGWEDRSGPCFNSLRIFPETMIASRKIYVGKPAWPNIEPTRVHSDTLSGNITTTSEYQTLHTLYASTWGFKKGDLVVARMKSNLNTLNPSGEQTSGKDVLLRVDGRSGSGTTEDPYTYKTLWNSITQGSKRHVPNDRVFIFPIDDDYNAIRVMLRSTNTGKAITSECSFDVYRL